MYHLSIHIHTHTHTHTHMKVRLMEGRKSSNEDFFGESWHNAIVFSSPLSIQVKYDIVIYNKKYIFGLCPWFLVPSSVQSLSCVQLFATP